jgi:hypothetical protein
VSKQLHKKFWDHEATQFNIHSIDQHSAHLDSKMGVGFDDLEGLSVRQQRQIIKNRCIEMNKANAIASKNR